jgi:hypothetical protein
LLQSIHKDAILPAVLTSQDQVSIPLGIARVDRRHLGKTGHEWNEHEVHYQGIGGLEDPFFAKFAEQKEGISNGLENRLYRGDCDVRRLSHDVPRELLCASVSDDERAHRDGESDDTYQEDQVAEDTPPDRHGPGASIIDWYTRGQFAGDLGVRALAHHRQST